MFSCRSAASYDCCPTAQVIRWLVAGTTSHLKENGECGSQERRFLWYYESKNEMGRETTYTSIHLYYAMYLLNTISKKKQYRNTPIPPFTSFSSHLKLSKHFGGKFQHLPFHSHQTLPETNSQFAAEKIGRNCPQKGNGIIWTNHPFSGGVCC